MQIGPNVDKESVNVDKNPIVERIPTKGTVPSIDFMIESECPEEVVNDKAKNQEEETKPKKILLKKDDRIVYKDKDDVWKEAVVTSRAGKATGKFANWYNIIDTQDSNSKSLDFGATEFEVMQDLNEEVHVVCVPKEQRNSPECLKAKMKELEKLKEFDVYEVVDDNDTNVISTTWVLSMKGDEIRARLVARGFEEEEEIDTASPTMQKSSLRAILSLSALKSWSLETTDIKSAFLQGADMERRVHIKPPKEADLPKGKVWLLKKCLYGLKDAPQQWFIWCQTITSRSRNLYLHGAWKSARYSWASCR